MTTDDVFNATISYAAAGVGFCADVNWMAIGAGILVLARLCVDVPKAYDSLRERFYGKSQRK